MFQCTYMTTLCGLHNKAIGKDYLMSNFVGHAMKLMHVLLACAQFCCFVLLISYSCKTVAKSKEAVADPLPKHLAVWLVEFSCVADPTFVQLQ